MNDDLARQIKFAIPSVTSRLHGSSADILGIPRLGREAPLVLKSPRICMFQLRGTDIPWVVARGWVDCGLCGLDAVIETQSAVSVLRRFPETATKIALIERVGTSAPRHEGFFSVVTEYPVITRSCLQARYRNLRVWKAHGACESFAFVDEIDGVVDIVDTGKTLRQNGLVVQEILFETCICLVAGQNLHFGEGDELLGEIQSSVRALTGSAPRCQEIQ